MAAEDGLVLHTSVPLVFHALTAGAAGRASHADTMHNLGVFQACELFDDRPSAERSDLDPALMSELRRLDVKLTLVTELLLELRAASHGGTAEKIDVDLDFRGMHWTPSGVPLVRGTRGVAEVYIHPQVPRPLRLYGTVTDVEPGAGRVRFHFDPLTESEADQLERLIFRAHRRQVAGIRSGAR